MKIGILTFWWSLDNYGQLLQCYALQRYLRDNGFEAFVIRYNPSKDYDIDTKFNKIKKLLNPVKVVKYIKYCLKKKKIEERNKKVLSEQKNNPRNFDDFREKYINFSEKDYSSYFELRDDFPPADVYIVGSDQVWNSTFLSKNALHAYLLDFGDKKTKRISFAASWGISKISKSQKILFEKYLSKFDYITVREESGVKLCEQCNCPSVKWVEDPTLLLNAEHYRKLYECESIKQNHSKYLFLYMLNNKCNFNISSVFEYANKNHLEVVYVTGNGSLDSYDKVFPSIPEWLSLIDNAEYVVTNSFHCSLFCILFNKQFATIKLNNKFKSMNSRFDSLFKRFNIKPRFITKSNFSVLDEKYVSSFHSDNNLLEVLRGY